MKILVLKFGGAALADLCQFQNVADLVIQKKNLNYKVVVVVSAMGKMTDELLFLASQISKDPPKREQDMLISVGERISMALLAMTLHEKGHSAISFTGSQAGIITCSRHSDARVIQVRSKRVGLSLEAGNIVIVAGFQGVSDLGEVTTLGRGGSDTTAVALAVSLKAESVEFYKDVKGIFDKDPKKDSSAVHLSNLTYKEAFEVVSKSDRKVIHLRAIELAEKNKMPLYVKSFKQEGEGSLIFEEGSSILREPVYEDFLCRV
ncbi:MAG: aspartate kinase [Chlamydiae bacterium]|jgi:aspartate kinase|nr:aspartate kinase [Chlamydiota bacterium]